MPPKIFLVEHTTSGRMFCLCSSGKCGFCISFSHDDDSTGGREDEIYNLVYIAGSDPFLNSNQTNQKAISNVDRFCLVFGFG